MTVLNLEIRKARSKRKCFPWRWEALGLGLLAGCLFGCGRAVTHPPISQEDAKKIELGMSLTDVEAVLGPAHDVSSQQADRLDEIAARIPRRGRTEPSSEEHTDRAWGGPEGWLAGRFSSAGKLWMVTSHFGGERPAHMQRGRVFHRSPSKRPWSNE